MSDEKSEYEKQRDATIASNRAKLQSLGLEPLTTPPPPKQRAPKRPRPASEATRASSRVRSVSPDYTGVSIDSWGDDEPRLRRELRATAEGAASSSSTAAGAPAAAASRRRPAAKEPRVPSAIVEGVRAYVQDHVPDDWSLEEREMFGMAMWMVNGNMFMGVGLRSQRLLVRVGEAQVVATLEGAPAGVARCGTPGGRTFPGTLMVDLDAFRGADKLGVWFELAMAHNATLEAKAPSDKPRKKKAAKKGAAAAPARGGGRDSGGGAAAGAGDAPGGGGGSGGGGGDGGGGGGDDDGGGGDDDCGGDDDDLEVVDEDGDEGGDDGAAAPPPAQQLPPRSASTSGGQFARCVLHVITRIPPGRVAAYGQVAALAGAPRNARQVGRMLAEGLCYGGAPWHRVLGASGRISLPAAAGGDRQRRLLEAEGVVFRESGAVVPAAFWERAQPFFA